MFEKERTTRLLLHGYAEKASIFSHLEPPSPPEHLPSPTAEKGNPGLVANDRHVGIWALEVSGQRKEETVCLWPQRRRGGARDGSKAAVRAQGTGFLQLPTLHPMFTCSLVFHLAHLTPRSLPCPQHPELRWKLSARVLGNQSDGKQMNGHQPWSLCPTQRQGRCGDP